MKIMKVTRVSYGKEITKLKDREYRKLGSLSSPVGTSKDWKIFANNNGFDLVEFKELDGQIWNQYIF